MSENGSEKVSTISNTPSGTLDRRSDSPVFAEIPIERPCVIGRQEPERIVLALDTDNSKDAVQKDEDASPATESSEKKPRTFIERLSHGAECAVDFLEERLLPVMEKPLTRILVGTAMLSVGIVVLLTPIPGGIILVPISIGVIFGVGPRRSWNAMKRTWSGAKALWRKVFPKKDEEEDAPVTAPAQ